jgi:CheY-like chemotaxis protein
MMAGTIDFVSEAGQGSSFWFTIPIGLAEDQITIEQLLRPRATLGSGSQLANIPSRLAAGSSVLLLSHSLVLREIVASYLSLYNIKVTAVQSLLEALELLKNDDLVPKLHELSEVPETPKIRTIIYDRTVGQEAHDSRSSVEGFVSANFSVAPSPSELEQFQSFYQVTLAAYGRHMPGLIVLGSSELSNKVAGSSSSYVGHLQKPFRVI